jgi:peptidyl-prolyl cis-trans isomerase C
MNASRNTGARTVRERARSLLGWLIALTLAGFAGCSRNSTPERSDKAPAQLSPTGLARVGQVIITRHGFEQEWQRRADLRGKEELLQEMIRFESLLAKARAAGVDRDPEVVAAFHRMVVGRFQEQELARRGMDSISISEAEVRFAYSNQMEKFTTPAQVRLRVIYCKTSPKADPGKRDELRQRARHLWKQGGDADDDGFRQLALQHSDDQATRYAGGDSGWIDPTDGDSRWNSAVRKAAASLSRPGEVAPLIETHDGFHIVRLIGTRPANVRPFEQVRDGLEHQLRAEKARQLRDDFFKEMQAGLAIEINREALDAVPQPTRSPAIGAPSPLPK